MAKEIERKFLVKSLDFKKTGTHYKIKQGYLSTENNRVVRVRIYGSRAFLTIKNSAVGYSRDEFEYEIPIKDAKAMLKMCIQPIIDKIRYIVDYKGNKWEIDVFNGKNSGLIIAEIELKSPNSKFKLPDFVGQEVTADSRYYNSYINLHPYSTWKSDLT
ncbi:MAG: CYTH domain-containing protein [Prevotellaceae bacterium]|nr:CYTH domain-containing protein [Prevotellaceae bacterium]